MIAVRALLALVAVVVLATACGGGGHKVYVQGVQAATGRARRGDADHAGALAELRRLDRSRRGDARRLDVVQPNLCHGADRFHADLVYRQLRRLVQEEGVIPADLDPGPSRARRSPQRLLEA